jgi:ADP-ribosylglycohydrolase
MALTLAGHVLMFGRVDQDALMSGFVRDFDIERGYGGGMVELIGKVRNGANWRSTAEALFGGTGSCGNGSAMRVAPLGAYFHDDADEVVDHAAAAAGVTHMHPEGVAGAVATAVATAMVASARVEGRRPEPDELLSKALAVVDGTEVGNGLRWARDLGMVHPTVAADILGSGHRITCQDTVPFCLWVAAWHLADYPAAIAACVDARGDVDTTCAITGGVVAAFTGLGTRDGAIGVPEEWLQQREPLPPLHSTPTP